MRLAKYLANAGVASRRASEQLIYEGRVHVGRALITTPVFFVEPGQKVYVDGDLVGALEDKNTVVYVLNKPVGVISTAFDPQGRMTVTEFAPPEAGRVYPVGRLDIDSSGLLLITNDGDLAHKLTHPSFEVPKTYEVRVAHPPISGRDIESLRRGIELEDGWTAPAEAMQFGPATFSLTLREGRNRQVRRMCEAIGHPVRELKRVKFGTLELGHLHEGDIRRLKQPEVEALRSLAVMPTPEEDAAKKQHSSAGKGGRRAQARASAAKQAAERGESSFDDGRSRSRDRDNW